MDEKEQIFESKSCDVEQRFPTVDLEESCPGVVPSYPAQHLPLMMAIIGVDDDPNQKPNSLFAFI